MITVKGSFEPPNGVTTRRLRPTVVWGRLLTVLDMGTFWQILGYQGGAKGLGMALLPTGASAS